MNDKRLEQLDSLRGLAAVSVLLGHYFSIVDPHRFYLALRHTPLTIIDAGHEAVLFFFVLSGFVLSLGILSNKRVSYKTYMIKRVSRIYFPYIMGILFSLLLFTQITRNSIPSLSDWFNILWVGSIDLKLLLNHLLLIGEFKGILNPVIWSLVQEMRISIIFPLLMLFVIKRNWKNSVLLGFIFSLICLIMVYYFGEYELLVSLCETLHYTSMFLLGALLAKHRDLLTQQVLKFPTIFKVIFLFVGVLLYTYPHWFMPDISLLHVWIVNDWVSSIGACCFIILSLSSIRIKNFLLIKPIHFLGKISYSIYIYHLVTLLAFVHLFYAQLSIPLIWVISFLVSLMISVCSYYLVELPSIKLGNLLTRDNKEAKDIQFYGKIKRDV